MNKRKGAKLESEADLLSQGEAELPSRVEALVNLCKQNSEDASDTVDAYMASALGGLTLEQISSSLPKVNKIENLFDQLLEISNEVVGAVNRARGACMGTFFSEKAINIMGTKGIVPALLTIPEASTWGKSSIQILELLDPFKDTIRTTFKPQMVQGLLAMYSKDEVCLMCLWPRMRLMKCSGCKEARYCSKECQKKDWTRHKKEDCVIKI